MKNASPWIQIYSLISSYEEYVNMYSWYEAKIGYNTLEEKNVLIVQLLYNVIIWCIMHYKTHLNLDIKINIYSYLYLMKRLSTKVLFWSNLRKCNGTYKWNFVQDEVATLELNNPPVNILTRSLLEQYPKVRNIFEFFKWHIFIFKGFWRSWKPRSWKISSGIGWPFQSFTKANWAYQYRSPWWLRS